MQKAATLALLAIVSCGDASLGASPGEDGGAAASDAAPSGVDAGSQGDAATAREGDAGSTLALCADGLFPADHFFCKDVSASAVAPESAAILGALQALGGWGNGHFDVTFGFHLLVADKTTPRAAAENLPQDPATDTGDFPVPAGGALENETGYACTSGADCHLLVLEQDARRLFELFGANQTSPGHFDVGFMTVWDLNRHYGPTGRGFGCSSSDAAGFPIWPGVLRVGEVASGEIRHALRFVLPNGRMRRFSMVAPATHYGGPVATDPNAPPYGVRLRLKPGFDESKVASDGARVVVRALKKYGMLLSDGGNVALTAEDDLLTSAKWNRGQPNHLLQEDDLRAIEVGDFDVVELGEVKTYTASTRPDCVRQ